MIDGRKVLAVIPARQNSKGLPGKNIIDLAGKPLIAWTIQAAKGSRYIDDVIVSTDGQQIAAIARSHGASVPFVRPAALAADDTPGVDTIIHACEQLPEFPWVVVLQPTSPLRTAQHIDEAVEELLSAKADFCVSVTPPKHHPNWLFKKTATGLLERYEDQPPAATRQSLPQLLALNGAIYIARVAKLLTHRSLIGDNTVPYCMPPEYSFDIDTETDLRICQTMIQRQHA